MKKGKNGEKKLNRREKLIKKAKRAVIKIGTQVLTTDTNRLDTSLIEHLVEQIFYLINTEKKEIIIVTSGAISAGMQMLNWKKRPAQINKLQAAASVGQSRLMRIYERIFKEEGINVGQILLTRDIFIDKERAKTAKRTILTLLKLGVVPIINENDSIAVEEIKFGDNDILSAYVSKLIDANILILLTDVDGIYRSYKNKKKNRRIIKEVYDIKEVKNISGLAQTSKKGTGGMKSKIEAARLVIENKIPCVIVNGKKKWVLKKLFKGESIGTFFYPAEEEI